MRSPVIAFGLFAAAAVSPSLVGAAPTSPNIGSAPAVVSHGVPNGSPHVPVARELHDKHHHTHQRRVEDFRTSGGNAYSGASGDTSGGNVLNAADNNDDELTNTDSSKSCGFTPSQSVY